MHYTIIARRGRGCNTHLDYRPYMKVVQYFTTHPAVPMTRMILIWFRHKTSILVDRSLRVSQTLTTPTTLWSFWSKLNQNRQTGHQGVLHELFFSSQFRLQTVSDSCMDSAAPCWSNNRLLQDSPPLPIFYKVFNMCLATLLHIQLHGAADS